MANTASVPLDEMIDKYLTSLESKRRAPSTINKHRSHLASFRQYIGTKHRGVRECLTPEVLDEYRDERMNGDSEESLSVSTLRSDKTILGGFIAFCMRRKVIKYGPSPTEEWSTPAELPHNFIRIPVEYWGDFLASAKNPRDRFLLAVGLYTFCRVSEIKSMTWADVLPSNEIQVTRWKTKQYAELTMFPELIKETIRWKTAYTKNLMGQGIAFDKTMPLIPSLRRPGQSTTSEYFAADTLINPDKIHQRPQEVVHYGLLKLGYESTDREGMHTLRRSGALAFYKYLVDQEVADPARVIMVLLGHESVITTEIYLGLDAARDRAAKLVNQAGTFNATGEQVKGLRLLQVVK